MSKLHLRSSPCWQPSVFVLPPVLGTSATVMSSVSQILFVSRLPVSWVFILLATFSINFAISFRPEFQLQGYQLRIPLNLEASSKSLYGLRKLSDLSGIAQWLERRTRDWKVAGSNPCWSGGRILFSGVDFLCWLISVSVPSPCYRSST